MKEFLQKIKRINCGRKVAIFLDNASIHRSKQILEFCEKLKIRLIFNIPYSPQLNGIEKLWAIWKK